MTLTAFPAISCALLLASTAPALADCKPVNEVIEAWASGGKPIQVEGDGSILIYGEQGDGSQCTLTLDEEGVYVFGSRAAGAGKSNSEYAVAATGEWVFRSDRIGGAASSIAFDASSNNETAIDGEASYTNSVGSISVGYFESVLKGSPQLPDAFTRIPAMRGDPPTASESCFLELRPLGRYLVVLDSGKATGRCGGENVSFTGVYRQK